MVFVGMYENGRQVDLGDENGSNWYEPEKALAKLVERLDGDSILECGSYDTNGTRICKIVVRHRDANEHFEIEFEGGELAMDLLQKVCALYNEGSDGLR